MSDPSCRFAFVTLVTNSEFARGAVALINSLRRTGTQADIVAMHSDRVEDSDIAVLAEHGALPISVPPLNLSVAFIERHARSAVHRANPFTKGRKPDFHDPLDNFLKLSLWQLTRYDRCVFLDADTLVVRNIDRLFEYPEFCAAPNVYESLADFHRMNSGVFVARPDSSTYAAMLDSLDRPGAYWPRTDQTFLQEYFPEWHGLPIYMNMLQYVWFNLPQLWDWNSVRVIHYQYEKPWEKDHPHRDELRLLIDLWQAYFRDENIPDLANLPNPDSPR